jgi:hypothetical protein
MSGKTVSGCGKSSTLSDNNSMTKKFFVILVNRYCGTSPQQHILLIKFSNIVKTLDEIGSASEGKLLVRLAVGHCTHIWDIWGSFAVFAGFE